MKCPFDDQSPQSEQEFLSLLGRENKFISHILVIVDHFEILVSKKFLH